MGARLAPIVVAGQDREPFVVMTSLIAPYRRTYTTTYLDLVAQSSAATILTHPYPSVGIVGDIDDGDDRATSGTCVGVGGQSGPVDSHGGSATVVAAVLGYAYRHPPAAVWPGDAWS